MLLRAESARFRHAPPLALLVDSDADTRHMYAEFLQTVSFTVDEAEDGRVALAKALSAHPNVVVTSTRLRGLSGYELCRILRGDSDTKDISLVVVTADAFPADIARAEAAGADVVLVKPCLPDVLVQNIQRLFARASELREGSEPATAQAEANLPQAADRLDAARSVRAMLSHTHRRGDTTMPSLPPPALRCTQCDGPLQYVKSYVGGVSIKHQEQWDYFACANGCGRFEYRQRTRTVRRVE